MRIVDAHCHLQDERFAGTLDAVLDRARSAGVEKLMCCGTSEADWEAVQMISGAREEVIPSFGLHPWFVADRSLEWLDRLRDCLLSSPSGVGEIGLDHLPHVRNDEEQETVFISQLELARELSRPVSIHCVRAWGRMMELLEPFGIFPAGLVLHSFSGPAELIPCLAELGAYFSFSGTVVREANTRVRSAALIVPPKRLLIETDAPDLFPDGAEVRIEDERGRPVNEPANIVRVINALAVLRDTTPEDVAETTCANARGLFEMAT